MAEVKFLSETPTEDDKVHQYQIEVTADLGDGDVQTHVQDVIFNPDEAQEKAQEYADEMESELKKQKEAEAKAQKEAEEAEAPQE